MFSEVEREGRVGFARRLVAIAGVGGREAVAEQRMVFLGEINLFKFVQRRV